MAGYMVDPVSMLIITLPSVMPVAEGSDSMLTCKFGMRNAQYTWPVLTELHNGLTGFGFSEEDLKQAGERIWNLERNFNVREGVGEDIQEIIEAFGRAARRAKEAGFDAIQIHGAHGFLVNQFLSPAFNKRPDAYGGPIENRARAVLEILQKMRSHVGDDFPILIKLNSEDIVDGGLTVSDSFYFSMSRPFIRESGLVARWASGDLAKATCLSDNLCRGPLLEGGGIYCVVEKKNEKE